MNKLYGFATFFKEDGLYYFQFNDSAGDPVLFSRGYKSEKSRDNSIQSVIRNAGDAELYAIKKTNKGRYYFLLKAANHQEIGRSKVFDSQEEAEEKMAIMKNMEEDVPVFEKKQQPEKKEPKAEGSKVVVQPPAGKLPEKPGTEQAGAMPRYKFSIIYYPDSQVWIIKQDQTGDSRHFKTYDEELISTFIYSHLPPGEVQAVPPAVERKPAPPRVPPQREFPQQLKAVMQELEWKIRDFKGEEIRNFAPVGNLRQIEITLKEDPAASTQVYDAEVTAKAVDAKETIEIGQAKEKRPRYGRLLVPIYGANSLKPGMYIIAITVRRGKEGEAGPVSSSSRLIMFTAATELV